MPAAMDEGRPLMSVAMLEFVGFFRVGEWRMVEGQPKCALTAEKTTCNILYAFVAGSEVLYTGVTTNILRKRMYQFQRPARGRTAGAKIREKIAARLSIGDAVEIYALPDPGDMEYRGVRLNVAAGLEGSLISGLDPPWNRAAKRAR